MSRSLVEERQHQVVLHRPRRQEVARKFEDFAGILELLDTGSGYLKRMPASHHARSDFRPGLGSIAYVLPDAKESVARSSIVSRSLAGVARMTTTSSSGATPGRSIRNFCRLGPGDAGILGRVTLAARIDQHRVAFGGDAGRFLGTSPRWNDISPCADNHRGVLKACEELNRSLGRVPVHVIGQPDLEHGLSL
ncbi:MAG: hypothetical protein ACRD0Q_00905 [Acidimicrobiales bacterium]